MVASYGLGDVIFLWSSADLGVPGALAIASCYPLWTALIGFFVNGESLSLRQILGLFLAVGGVVIVLLSHSRIPILDEPKPNLKRGVVLAIIVSFFWALNSFSVSRAGRTLSPFVANTVRMIIALFATFVLSRFLGKRRKILLPAQVFRSQIGLFVFEAFGGSLVFVYGLAHSPLALGSILSSLAPVLSVPVAWFLKLERFSVPRTFGVAATVTGISLLL
jgi:drug/metabolite transporter (DMT)-like permease